MWIPNNRTTNKEYRVPSRKMTTGSHLLLVGAIIQHGKCKMHESSHILGLVIRLIPMSLMILDKIIPAAVEVLKWVENFSRREEYR